MQDDGSVGIEDCCKDGNVHIGDGNGGWIGTSDTVLPERDGATTKA